MFRRADPYAQAAQQLASVTQADPKALAGVLRQVVKPAGVVGVAWGGRRQVVGLNVQEGASFELASVTKPFTAALVRRLAQGGRLDLTAPLSQQFASFRGYPPQVTAQALLTHTAGLPVHPLRSVLGQVRHFHDPYGDLSPAEVLASGRRWAWAACSQAGKLSYSNLGYGLLALAAREAAGEPYFTALGRHILLPLGLNHTAETPRTPLALPHGLLGSQQTSGFGGLTGAGGLYSTAHDLLGFAGAHLQGQLSGWETFDTPPALRPPLLGVARGWFVGKPDGAGEALWWHDGVARGTRSLLAFCPDTGAAACVLVGSGLPLGGRPDELLRVAVACGVTRV